MKKKYRMILGPIVVLALTLACQSTIGVVKTDKCFAMFHEGQLVMNLFRQMEIWNQYCEGTDTLYAKLAVSKDWAETVQVVGPEMVERVVKVVASMYGGDVAGSVFRSIIENVDAEGGSASETTVIEATMNALPAGIEEEERQAFRELLVEMLAEVP